VIIDIAKGPTASTSDRIEQELILKFNFTSNCALQLHDDVTTQNIMV
jgi:hypothetical protein